MPMWYWTISHASATGMARCMACGTHVCCARGRSGHVRGNERASYDVRPIYEQRHPKIGIELLRAPHSGSHRKTLRSLVAATFYHESDWRAGSQHPGQHRSWHEGGGLEARSPGPLLQVSDTRRLDLLAS